MIRRNNGLMDRLGNYLCALGISNVKIEHLIIPLAGMILLITVFAMIANSLADFGSNLLLGFGLTENMSSYIEMTAKSLHWSWFIGGAIMFWLRFRGTVNALQTSVNAVFYVAIVLCVIGKFTMDYQAGSIDTESLGLVFYAVSFIGSLIGFCIVTVVATLVGAPIYISAAVLAGLAIDILLAQIFKNTYTNTAFFTALRSITNDVDLRKQIAEVQLVDSGVYFVNPAAKVVRRIHFSQYHAKDLNLFTRKIFLMHLMKLLPVGYHVDALVNMWVANNTKLQHRLSQSDAVNQTTNK